MGRSIGRASPDSGRSQLSEDAIRRSAYYDFIQQHVAGLSGFTHANRPSLFQDASAANKQTTAAMAL